jgi:predicted metal-binding protein
MLFPFVFLTFAEYNCRIRPVIKTIKHSGGKTMAEQKGRARLLGGKVSEETLKADLERYCKLALEMGASQATIVPASEVVVDERVRLKCVVPRCLRAGETPNCPPNAPDLDLVRKAIARYSWAIMFKCNVEPMEDYDPGRKTDKERRTLDFHAGSAKVVFALERQAYKDGYSLAMGFGGGSCKDYLCKGMICQFLDNGRCRFPNRSRPAMEAAGIDVVDLINKVRWESFALLDDLSKIACAVSIGIVFIY